MLRRDISKALFATAAGSAAVAPRAEAQSCTAPCYAQTAAEMAAINPVTGSPPVVPTNYAYAPGPFIDVRRYGFAESASAATNTTALNSALAVAAAQTNGGWVQLPSGSFQINQPNAIPAFVLVSGAAKRATQLVFGGSSVLFTLGGTGSSLYYGCGLTDLDIRLSSPGAEAVRVQGTQGAKVERLYIQGQGGNTGAGVGVTIDGGNASSFQNHVRDVQCNHIGQAFRMLTSGSVVCTQTIFENCYAASGDGGSSIGFNVQSNCGNGSLWVGGDIETQGTGISIDSSSGFISFHGTRFEGNTTDILFNLTCANCVFIGCVNIVNVTDNSGGGYQNHQFIGCIQGTGTGPWANYPNKMVGSLNVRSGVSTDVPLQVQPFAGQTGDVFRILNVPGNGTNFSLDAGGQIETLGGNALKITSGSGSPNGVVTASPGALYLNVGGGSINTLWVKESGTDTDTGWIAK